MSTVDKTTDNFCLVCGEKVMPVTPIIIDERGGVMKYYELHTHLENL